MNRTNCLRRTRSLLVGLAALLCAAAPALAAGTAQTALQPNIVFVLFDDAGFSDFGAYGSEVATPHIDSLANSGVRFTNFHTASTCEATRAMLQSGVDNHLAGAGTLKVTLAANQKGKPGYEGHLSDKVHNLAQLMRNGGYATYYAGKWDLGHGLEHSPGAHGWDRYLSLEQTGADNFEAKVYAPLDMEAVWWEDGKRATLPADFYSSKHYVDKMIQYIDDGRASGKPFLGMVAFQAVHQPQQAPQADIDKYMKAYDAGWVKVRAERYRRQVQMGLVQAGLQLQTAPQARDWDGLSDSERRLYAKKMAVYAGMLDSADQEIGRLREHLRKIGQLDNTVFIVMSDNGGDGIDLTQLNLPFKAWYRLHYAHDVDRLGGQGAYSQYGRDWAEVSNTPFAGLKGSAAEGGMRVPFIVSYPARIQPSRITNEFAYVTDFLPTVLDIAGITLPGAEGKNLHRPTGASMLPYLEGRAAAIHAPTESIGFEATGAQTLYRSGYKLVRNGAPWGDNRWRLFKLSADPTESTDLSASEPALYKQLLGEVEVFNQRNGVVLPEAGYDPVKAVLANNWQILLRQMGGLVLAIVLTLALLIYLALRLRRRMKATRWPTAIKV